MAAKEKSNTECNHKGHLHSAGIVPVNEAKGLNIIVVLYCDLCGRSMANNIRLQKFEIPQTKVEMPFKPKGN
jgi:hypothetical protein